MSTPQILQLQNQNSIFRSQSGEIFILLNQSSPLNSPENIIGQITPIQNVQAVTPILPMNENIYQTRKSTVGISEIHSIPSSIESSPISCPMEYDSNNQFSRTISSAECDNILSREYANVDSIKAIEQLKNKQEYNKRYYQEKTKQRRAMEKQELKQLQEKNLQYEKYIQEIQLKIQKQDELIHRQQLQINYLVSSKTSLPKIK